MKTSSLLKKSKFLSKLLRHNPELIESTIDKEGWMNTSDLIKSGEFTIDELEQIVKEDNKKRYELTKDKRKIRALQGHSISGINPGFVQEIPPGVLYHGTSTNLVENIMNSGGLKSMSRDYIHLSTDLDTAVKVGKRHGNPCVIIIDSLQMSKDGILFLKSKNGYYLVKETIPTKYFIEIKFDF